MSTSTESWFPVPDHIPGHEGYEGSDLGNIRSVDRWIMRSDGHERFFPSRVLKPNDRDTNRHLTVRLAGQQRAYVHHVIAAIFLGPRPPGMCVLHRDDDKHNNRPQNLYHGILSDNGHDCVRNGNHKQANKLECPAGHPYVAENVFVYRGSRRCRECHREHNRRWWHNRQAVAA